MLYEIWLHGEKIDETNLKGIAWLKFESAKLVGFAKLFEIYDGDNFDPVLHTTIVHSGGIKPPCPENKVDCQYRKSIKSDFYSTPRKTAFRTEITCPIDRCGFLLKPSKIGGVFTDYDYCLW